MSTSSNQCTNESKHSHPQICWEKVNDDLWEDIAPIFGDLCHLSLKPKNFLYQHSSHTSPNMAYWNGSLPGHMEIGGDLGRMKRNNKDITGQNSARNYFHCNPSTFLQFEPITKFSDIKLKYPRGGACINRRNSKLTDLTMPRPSARDNNRTNQTSVPVNVMPILPQTFHVTTAHTQNCHSV